MNIVGSRKWGKRKGGVARGRNQYEFCPLMQVCDQSPAHLSRWGIRRSCVQMGDNDTKPTSNVSVKCWATRTASELLAIDSRESYWSDEHYSFKRCIVWPKICGHLNIESIFHNPTVVCTITSTLTKRPAARLWIVAMGCSWVFIKQQEDSWAQARIVQLML